jgi:hypothetical protein
MQNLLNYINWKQIIKEHKLKSGYLSSTQEGKLKDILIEFIRTNN